MNNWYQLSPAETLETLKTDNSGLSENEAITRAAQYGPNALAEKGAKNPWLILWEQFTATMVLILIAAALLSAFLAKWTEAISIIAIVLLFTILGFIQEYRAERAMAALKKLTVPSVRVRRNGQTREIPAPELVPGDIIFLEAGNVVPADVRIIENANLRIQEAALTGESEPVEKSSLAIPGTDLALGDRRNLGYLGTIVTYGRGVAVVIATGMRTELGRIANLLQSVESDMTPLQQRLDQVGKVLAIAGTAVALLIMLIGLLSGEEFSYMVLTAISVAVAVVPEGLPAVVTFTLALGARRMLQRNALIRKLPAVETLGSVTTICSDKTGTLTENRMTVTVLEVADQRLDLLQTQTDLETQFATPTVQLLLAAGVLCNDAELKGQQIIGDPTEGALLTIATRARLIKADLQIAFPRRDELPFDSERKRMTTFHSLSAANYELTNLLKTASANATHVSFTKGAVDGLLELTSLIWVNNRAESFSNEWKARIETANRQLAQNGMRVLGVAMRLWENAPIEMSATENQLVLIGLVGIIDPPRAEVKQAVRIAKQAGIRPVMITGDHPLTASFIARDLGIATNDRVLTGQNLERMTADELAAQVEEIAVYARVAPEHKLKIVDALQKRGHIVAMTGDGVNDAPALKKADIGVAMGITGTDVSKEAADMVLRDDNFATIVAAVEEGRVIYDNVRRFVKFSIAGNIGKVMVMLLAPFMGISVAITPLQMLWLNLLTDGLLGLGMGFEPAEKNTMQRPPHSPQAGVFSDGLGVHVIWVGILIGVIALVLGGWYYLTGREQWQTVLFSTLAFAQVWQAFGTRSIRESLFTIGIFTNKVLFGLIISVVALQLGVLLIPGLKAFFRVIDLTSGDLFLIIVASSLVFIATEIEKWLIQRR